MTDESALLQIESALQRLLLSDEARDFDEFEKTYRAVYRLVLRKKADVVYDTASRIMGQCAFTRLQAIRDQPYLLREAPALEDQLSIGMKREMAEHQFFLLKQAWDEHYVKMNMLGDMFLYLVSLISAVCE